MDQYDKSRLATWVRFQQSQEEFVDERPERLRFSESVHVDHDIADGSVGSLKRFAEHLQAALDGIPISKRDSATLEINPEYNFCTVTYVVEETEAAYTARKRKAALRAQKRAEKQEAEVRATLAALKAKYGES
jgi:hypothetical protein